MNSEQEEHSPFSPSGAHRWMECPGSVMLEAQMPEEEETAYQAEGTLAHELAAKMLKDNMWIADNYPTEMQNYVREYASVVKEKTKDLPLLIEEKISLDSIDSRLYGTVDAMAYRPGEGILYVFDLKYGKGVEVQVENNPQLMYYALCGMESCFANKVELTVIQPRIDGQTVKTITYTTEQLIIFSQQLRKAVHMVDTMPDLTMPGQKQCQWCSASAICPSQAQTFQAVTSIQPKNDKIDMPMVSHLSAEEAGNIYLHTKQMIKWLNDVEGLIHTWLNEDKQVPNAKLVMQRKNRVIKDPETAKKALQKKGYKVKDIIVQKLKSPNQLEAAGVPKAIVKELSIIPKGQLVVALETDKRLAETPENKLDFNPVESEKTNEFDKS